MSRKHEARSLILRGVCLDGGIRSNALRLPGEGGYHDEPLRPARLRVDCHRRLFGTTLGERTPNAPTTRPHSTHTTPPRTRTTRTTRTTIATLTACTGTGGLEDVGWDGCLHRRQRVH